MSTESFADLGVSDAVIRSLSAAGITEPFAIQRAVIGDAIAGRDVIAKSPTGSGKTLAFGIPLVERIRAEDERPAALVLAPTRELATQIVDEIRLIAHARALRITAVYGGVGLVKQARDAARAHALVATPGRLEDLLARGAFTLANVRMLILDEADRILDMGFRPAIDRIVAASLRSVRHCSSPPPWTEKPDASPTDTRTIRRSTSTARPHAAPAPRSSIGSCRSHTSTASSVPLRGGDILAIRMTA
jgi:superfamily II DNA/RNA helicase